MEPLRVLLTNQDLIDRRGGGLYVRDLAIGLLRQGHRPVVYSGRLGDLAREIREHTIPVIDRLASLSESPHIIHGNTPVETVAALLHFQESPAVFTCHAWISPDAMPPKFRRILRYIAVDETCQDRLLCEEGIPPQRVTVQYNSVDLQRFPPRGQLPPRPKLALVFSNNANDETYVPAIQAACAKLDVKLEVMGEASGHPCPEPEKILGHYDLVFAKARAALEAMACGTAVVLCDSQGMGQMVTFDDLDRLRSQNFGWRSLQNPIDEDLLVREIERYDPVDAARVSEKIRATEGLDVRVDSMIEIYRRVIEESRRLPLPDAPAQMREVAEYLQVLAPMANTFFAKNVANLAWELQKQWDSVTDAFEMHPLSPESQAGIRLAVDTGPARARSVETLRLRVALENGSDRLLCSFPPNPLHFSYQWLDATTSEVVIGEGRRSQITPPLQPGATRPYLVDCETPEEPGEYILRVTLVQEQVKWFDQEGPDRALDLHLTIE